MKQYYSLSTYKLNYYITMTSKDKIFSELGGVFKWIEHKKAQQGETNMQETTSYHKIKEFFNFLNLEINNEEIEALDELANPEGNATISYDDLLKIFVQDDKTKEKEKTELKNAFKVLSKGIES